MEPSFNISEEANCSLPLAVVVLSLDELLDSLGFDTWKTTINSIVLPLANVFGLILCSLSAWIFFRGHFTDPVFAYYRVLSIVNILSLMHNIPEGIFFSPRYFPNVNTYDTAIYQIYCASMSFLLFHFGETLQIGILLTRMKSFNPFINSYFKASPKLICFLFFLTCLIINSPLAFSLKISSFGNYYFRDSNSDKQEATFYYPSSSEFASSSLGKSISAINIFFMNLLLSLIIGIILNVVSFLQYKASLIKRQREFEALELSSIHNRATTSLEFKQQRQKSIDQIRIKRQMYMAFALCSVSITSRVIILLSGFLFLFYYSFSNFLLLQILSYFNYFFVPTVSFFIFYFFNNTFHKELKKIISFRITKNNNIQ